MKTLDGKRVRIKGTDVVTKVRFCTQDEKLGLCAVVEVFGLPFGMGQDQAKLFINPDNPYGDMFPLDQIEVGMVKDGKFTAVKGVKFLPPIDAGGLHPGLPCKG